MSEERTYSVELTLPELRVITKFLGTSLDVTAKKLDKLGPTHFAYADVVEQFSLLTSALDQMRDVQTEAYEEAMQ